MTIRLAIVDDQGMVRAGFRSLLAGEDDFEVVGEAANGEEAIELVTRLVPDVTLMDIRMPVLDGIAATRRLVEAGVETKVRRADHLRPRRVRLRGPACRRLRLPAQGRARRGARRRDPRGRGGGVPARAGRHPPRHRRVRTPPRATDDARGPRLQHAHAARARGARPARARAVQPRHRRASCSSPRAPPRPT